MYLCTAFDACPQLNTNRLNPPYENRQSEKNKYWRKIYEKKLRKSLKMQNNN